ncbi:hypothetical protein EDF35_1910 [Rathayibacter sp. PhB151]|uniref:hypothetical protein n=1 Tax=Rathayibacter sp. PhB151 TaxID=2485189 RepID=UPI0010641DCE|nr:hypothetical protein [Rathayibacter sp. PhB151]TDX78696.1 hypothetical protein EDF35_1910 [Rathayibacter sp. PhB151]
MTIPALDWAEQIAVQIQAMPTATHGSEAELQAALAAHIDGMARAAVTDDPGVVREVPLSDGHSRIDLMVYPAITGGPFIGVEVKVKGAPADVFRQLARYAECEEVHGLVLVTTSSRHLRMPRTFDNGKPLVVAMLLEGGL